MKQTVIVLCCALSYLGAVAQKVVEKNLAFKGQSIQMDVKFAKDIQVKTWDKQEVYFKANIRTEGGKFLDLYQVDIRESSSMIHIESRAEPVFKAFREEWERNHPGESQHYYHSGDLNEFNYVLYVPKNARFSISSINGNLHSDLIEGDFEADLINGNINIAEYAGSLKLSTINGEIDLKMLNTSLLAETLHGNIYADDKLKLVTTDGVIGQKVEGRFDTADSSLRLNTINGNMYLRQ